ncbi:MAG TPA: glycosyltransferase family 39 protein [Gemmatimonadales bacterium]|nr:glycosyltransferase family 39 protein [Gemmatimonadales bacterium]
MRRPLGPGTAAGLVIAFGVALRVGYFVQRPSLWGDEAMLALNIGGRSFGRLLSPLDYAQIASFPFLWLERAAFLTLGANEYALRLWPLIAGCVLLVLVYRLAVQIVPAGAAVLATAIAATAYPLIRYSGEVKPYTLDACVSAVVLLCALAVLREPDVRRGWVRLGAIGTIGIIGSLSAVFTCAAALVTLAAIVWTRRSRDGISRVAMLAITWLVAFAGAYRLALTSPATAAYMQRFWEAAFLRPGTPHLSRRVVLGLGELACSVNCWGGIFDRLWLVAGLTAAGSTWVALRRGRATALLLLATLTAPFGASVAGEYPIAVRLLLFTTPALAVLCAAGVWWAGTAVSRSQPAAGAALLGVLFVGSAAIPAWAWVTVQSPIEPSKREEIRPLVKELAERGAPGEPVYIFARTIPGWTFYTTDWRWPDPNQLRWTAKVAGLGGPSFNNGAARGRRSPAMATVPDFSWRRHRIVIGTSTGAQARAWLGFVPTFPDTGWAETEAERLHAAAHARAWVLLSGYAHTQLDESAPLLEAIRRTGGTVHIVSASSGAELLSIDYPQPPAIVAGPP